MASAISYVTELEDLIVNKLLPVYDKYCAQNNIPINYDTIAPSLIKEIKRKKVLPALLRPKEN